MKGAHNQRTLSPVERAAAVYDREPCARTFREDLEAHLLNGYVFSTPETFLMGRVVQRDADPALIVDPWHRFEAGDCWMVYLSAGCILRDVPRLMPFPLPWLAWERGNKLRFWRTERVLGEIRERKLLHAPSGNRSVTVCGCSIFPRTGPARG